MKKGITPEPAASEPETSPEAFELLDNFLANFSPTSNVEDAIRTYTTKEIIAAVKDFNADLHMRESDIVKHLKQKGFHYQMLPDNFAIKFHWLFAG